MNIIITPCTKNKAVISGFTPERPGITPEHYLGDPSIDERLTQTRKAVRTLLGPHFGSPVGQQISFEMYTCHGRLYDKLRADPILGEIRNTLSHWRENSKAQWFFLSGGYGLLHGAEIASAYQAVFDPGIAKKARIPCTLNDWASLPQILDGVFDHLGPERIYVVGSAAYVKFIEATDAFESRPDRFEISRGRASSHACRQAVVDFARKIF